MTTLTSDIVEEEREIALPIPLGRPTLERNHQEAGRVLRIPFDADL